MVHPATLSPAELSRQCQLRTTRRSGPGGQHRNKVETAVVVEHLPTGLTAEANERRSQGANRQQAFFRLRLRLALEVRSPEVAQQPSERWRQRVRQGRVMANREHEDFPALVAEVLDRLARDEYDVAVTADFFQITRTQLVKFLRLEPAALVALNSQRAERGWGPLK